MVNTSQKIVVDVEARETTGKNPNRRLRAAGRVPGNVYGLNLDPFKVSVDPRRIEELLRYETGRNTILTLSMAGKDEGRDVMVRELQRDPVTERLLHVDFVRVDPKQAVHVRVPVQLIGTPEGVKNELGVIDFVHRDILVSCLPAAIPEHLDVDISELHIGQHVAVKDLSVHEGVELLEDGETIVAVVAAPRKEAEVAEEVEGEEIEVEGEAAEGEEGTEAKTEEESGKDDGGS